MHIKDIWPSLRTMARRKTSLPWYSKPFLGFRNELITTNKQLCIISEQIEKLAKQKDVLTEQNDELINMLIQLIKFNGRQI